MYDNAVLTKADLILKSNTLIDGYNSFDASDTGTDADIATQSATGSSVVLNNGVVISGNVRVGLGGNPDSVVKDLGATIDGSKHAATENEPLPEITAPTTLFNMGKAITAKGATITITPADSGKYTDIALKAAKDPGVLEISSGDVELHITGNINLGNSCEIIVKDGSSLTIYIDGDIACDNGSSISVEDASKDAKTLMLYSTGKDVQVFDLKAKNEWVGVIYAPNADISLYAKGDAYGAIVANTFEFKSGGNYHYDRALKKVSSDDEGVRFVVTNWNES
ncbi:MAG: collagen-binding domain-containing protein [Planctomycetota bacterium]|nr:collagen-binding domain-containing protein [Planctomycetota bacterium]